MSRHTSIARTGTTLVTRITATLRTRTMLRASR
jgi:hypothetical protein